MLVSKGKVIILKATPLTVTVTDAFKTQMKSSATETAPLPGEASLGSL